MHYPEHIRELRLKLEELDQMMGYHSPRWGELHYAGMTNDQRLTTWLQKREKLQDDIDRMELQMKRIQGILSLVDEPVRSMFIESYTGRNTVDSIAEKYHYSPSYARKIIDRSIRQAMRMYEDLEYLENEKKAQP